jgi:hypothetical protein
LIQECAGWPLFEAGPDQNIPSGEARNGVSGWQTPFALWSEDSSKLT